MCLPYLVMIWATTNGNVIDSVELVHGMLRGFIIDGVDGDGMTNSRDPKGGMVDDGVTCSREPNDGMLEW